MGIKKIVSTITGGSGIEYRIEALSVERHDEELGTIIRMEEKIEDVRNVVEELAHIEWITGEGAEQAAFMESTEIAAGNCVNL